MALKTLPVDREWVRRMIGLADGPWERGRVEAAFVEYGWARPRPDGSVDVEWSAGPGSPHFFDDIEGVDVGMHGWRLELGAPPGGDRTPESYVRLPCALFWPAFGEEHEPGGHDPDAEGDDLDDDYSDDWVRHPDARRADFHAEHDRLAALLRGEIGEPSHVVAGDMDECREIWRRDGMAVVLHRTDDLNSYSHYDLIAITVCPATAQVATP